MRSISADLGSGPASKRDFAHRFDARVYMTLNTIVNDSERLEAVRLAWLAYENGVDALIVQDMGILDSDLPPIQLHASTQCDVRSPQKARFLESVGFSQVVLARNPAMLRDTSIGQN